MDVVILVLAIICCLLGFAGCIVPVLPGPPLCYVAMLLAHWSGFVRLSITEFVVWAAVVIIVTVIDFFLTPWMTRRFGGSKAGSWCAMLGLVVGMFLPWPVGPLLGPFLGALLGEIVFAKKDTASATHAALGSFLSFFVGTGVKLIACGSMLAASLCALV